MLTGDIQISIFIKTWSKLFDHINELIINTVNVPMIQFKVETIGYMREHQPVLYLKIDENH